MVTTANETDKERKGSRKGTAEPKEHRRPASERSLPQRRAGYEGTRISPSLVLILRDTTDTGVVIGSGIPVTRCRGACPEGGRVAGQWRDTTEEDERNKWDERIGDDACLFWWRQWGDTAQEGKKGRKELGTCEVRGR